MRIGKSCLSRLSKSASMEHGTATCGNGSIPFTLCESLAASLVGDDRSVELHTLVGGGAVFPATAGSIGLLVDELVINSLKHAFPAGRNEGHVVIAFETDGPDWKLVVSDNEIGAPMLHLPRLDMVWDRPSSRHSRSSWMPTPRLSSAHSAEA